MTKQIRVQKALYSQLTVESAIYKLAGKCTANLRQDGEDWVVDLEAQDQGPTTKDCVRLFTIELNDQSLRAQISDRTSRLKDLLLANAFSATSLVSIDDSAPDQAGRSV